jgi:hypothetical protein
VAALVYSARSRTSEMGQQADSSFGELTVRN